MLNQRGLPLLQSRSCTLVITPLVARFANARCSFDLTRAPLAASRPIAQASSNPNRTYDTIESPPPFALPSPVARRDEDYVATTTLDAASAVAAMQRATEAAERAAMAAEQAAAAAAAARSADSGADLAVLQRTADAAQQAAAAADRAASRATEAAARASEAAAALASSSSSRHVDDQGATEAPPHGVATSGGSTTSDTAQQRPRIVTNLREVSWDVNDDLTDTTTERQRPSVPSPLGLAAKDRTEWTHHADGTFTHAALSSAGRGGDGSQSRRSLNAPKPKRFLDAVR